MPAQCVGTRETAAAAPLAALLELSLAHEFLLARVQALVTLSVVLARECLPAHRADERTLISVGAEMGAQVVGSGEALGAERALESSRVLLDALGIAVVGAHSLVLWICEPEDILSVGKRGC